MSKEEQEVRVYKLCPDQYKQIVDEIRQSRELNTEEHTKIFASATESAELAAQIQSVIDKWNNFWSVIMTLRTVTFTFGFVVAMAYFITKLYEMTGLG